MKTRNEILKEIKEKFEENKDFTITKQYGYEVIHPYTAAVAKEIQYLIDRPY